MSTSNLNYLGFVIGNIRFLAFGFLLSFFSSFGQTYVISVFNPDIRAQFGLSHGDFGMVFAVATVGSALCLIWFGRMIDRTDLRRYTLAVLGGLVSACLLMAAVPTTFFLLLALFALRLTGQGLMVHTSATTMARYFDEARGKAVSLVSVGSPLGQGLLAVAALAILRSVGWRWTWAAFAALVAAGVVPLALFLLRGHKERHRRFVERAAERISPELRAAPSWSRREVLKDPRFYLILPVLLAPSYISTGFFFHMAHLVESKGWSLTDFTEAYFLYVVVISGVSLLTGPLVDRVGAVRLLPYYLIPQGVSMLAIAGSDHPGAAVIYMLASGVTVGLRVTIGGAIWAEIYGVAHLGGIRALSTSFMVLATALAPVTMGWWIDMGVTMESIALGCIVFVVLSSLLAWFAIRFGDDRAPAGR
jgi:predicted MFS family arabinose efflux permease